GILLHRGYGSDKRAGAKALIKLAQKSVREIGNLKLAVELLKDSLNKIDKEITPKLAELVQVLLIEYHTNTGNYMEAESIFDIALAEIEKIFFPGMRVWKVQLYRRVIPAITQAHNFVKAEQLAGEALKLVKSGDIINEIAIKNCRARVLYEKFFYEGGDIELLKEAKHKYEETRKLEATVPEENRNRILNNEAGFISISLGKYAEAAQDLELKFQRDKKEKKFFGEIATAIALANTYQLLEDYKAAEKFALSALRLAKIAKQGKWLFEAHHVLANVYHDLAEGYHDSDKTDLAICEGNKCAALGAGMGKITESVLQLWVTIADCYKVQKDNDRAIMFIEAAKKAGAAGYHLMRAEVVLGEIYYDKHDYKASHSHFNIAKDMLLKMPSEISKKFSARIARFTINADESTIKKS
ncbi:MAG: tetratricopeptide repeat protein, partial [Deltaproteobacteria bacterium]|nr:tetratricopeptide repeat protein [Deltaproteobacteria bacterium]